MERSNAEDSELEQLEASVVEASWRNAQRFGVVGSLAIGVSMRVEMGEITLSELVVVAWCSLCIYMQLARKIQKAKLLVRVPHLIRFVIRRGRLAGSPLGRLVGSNSPEDCDTHRGHLARLFGWLVG